MIDKANIHNNSVQVLNQYVNNEGNYDNRYDVTILVNGLPLVSIEEQNRIVNILDKFEKLINDISEGLPAEIELRRKQYEYYRNKLLNFKEVN